MKINWGTAIAIFMASFMIFILYFVYLSFADERYDHHFVSKQYYKDEVNYQQEIDAVDNAKKLKKDVIIASDNKGLEIFFPPEFSKIEGTIKFQRTSNEKLDFELPIQLDANNTLLIPKDKLVSGLYNVKIEWTANNTKYLYKDKLMFD